MVRSAPNRQNEVENAAKFHHKLHHKFIQKKTSTSVRFESKTDSQIEVRIEPQIDKNVVLGVWGPDGSPEAHKTLPKPPRTTPWQLLGSSLDVFGPHFWLLLVAFQCGCFVVCGGLNCQFEWV